MSTIVTEKTGIIVTAYIPDEKKGLIIKQLDISELQPGMMVREIGGLLKIAGPTIDDGEDYAIHTEDAYYSPLLIDTNRTEIKASPESEHKIDFISIDEDGNEHMHSYTIHELVETLNFDWYKLPNANDSISECVFCGEYLNFTTFSDLLRAFIG